MLRVRADPSSSVTLLATERVSEDVLKRVFALIYHVTVAPLALDVSQVLFGLHFVYLSQY